MGKIRRILAFLCLMLSFTTMSSKGLLIDRISDYPSLDSIAPSGYQKSAGYEPVSMLVKDNSVYLAVEQPVSVALLNILGHVLGHDELKPGTYRLQLPERGLYIVKAGQKIIRVTR